jgi:excisionase family DNA binding protein
MTNSRTLSTASLQEMLDVQGVAQLLNCSTRHVYRLSDAGRMPAPVKLGALCRWSKSAIEDWIAAGCPSCRQGGRR